MRKQEYKSTIIERVQNNGLGDDLVSNFKWLSRMNCYVEGNARGQLRFRDIEKKGECFLMMGVEFSDRI